MLWPAVARALRADASSARTREHARRLRTAFQAQTLAHASGRAAARSTSSTCALMTDDTGILQHAAFSVPRYDDGYCLDDNARALLLMTLVEDAGTEDAAARARARVALSRVRQPRVQPCTRALPQLHVATRASGPRSCGSEDSHGRALWALGTVVGRSARSRAAQPRRPALSRRAARDRRRSRARARGRTRCSASTSTCARSRATRVVQAAARALAERLLELFRAHERARLAVVRGARHVLQRAPAAGAARLGRADASDEAMTRGRPALARVARRRCSATADGVLRADRLERLLSCAASRRRASISSPSRPARWSRRASRRDRVTGERRWARARARAFNWFLGQNQLHAVALRRRRPAAAATGCTPIASNENQGAESTLSFLLALIEMRAADRARCDRSTEHGRAHDAMTGMTRGYETLFHRHAAQSDSHARPTGRIRRTPSSTPARRASPTARRCCLCRVEDRRGHSHLCAARSANGVDGWVIDAEPTLVPDPERYPEELWGIEDPRITFVDGARQVRDRVHRVQQGRPGRRARADRGLSHASSATASSCSPTTRTRRCCRAASTAASRSSIVRCTDSGAHVWISYSPDLRNWGGHKLMLQARKGAWWDANKVGLSPPLIETPRGWLMLYHGVRHTARAASIASASRSSRSTSRSSASLRGDAWIFGPEAPYERDGDVGNVAFPCGYTIGADGDTHQPLLRRRRHAASRSRPAASASCCAGSTSTAPLRRRNRRPSSLSYRSRARSQSAMTPQVSF